MNISADPAVPLWVDPGDVVAVGGIADTPDEFRRGWILLRGCQAVMPVPMTGSRHIMRELERARGLQ